MMSLQKTSNIPSQFNGVLNVVDTESMRAASQCERFLQLSASMSQTRKKLLRAIKKN